MKAALLIMFLLAPLLACVAQDSKLIEKEARKLACDFVNSELKGKEYENFKRKKQPYPKFEPHFWRTAEVVAGRWLLKFDPPAGIYAQVSFDPDGKKPKLESYGYSPE